MNIMIIITNLNPSNGGVTTHVIDLCRELDNKGHNVFLLYDAATEDYKKKIDEIGGIKTYCINLLNVRKINRFFSTFNKILKIVKKEKIDIIHTHAQSGVPFCILIKAMKKIPFVWTNHINAIAQPKIFKIILNRFKFPIISVSEDLKYYLMDEFKVNGDRITVICNGIYLKPFKQMADQERNQLRKQYNLENKYVISLLARITFGKGHDYLLQAVKQLQENYGIKNIKILFAGKVYDQKEWLDDQLKYAKENNIDVDYLGFKKPREIFGISDLSVLPSLWEGFGLTCIESLAMECPVVRSNTPGWSDMKDITLVCEKENSKSLAEKLYYAYINQEEMKLMAIKGKNSVYKKFTVEIMTEKTVALYKKLIEK